MFIGLDNFKNRSAPNLSGHAVLAQLNAQFGELRDALVFVLPPPPVQGLGSTAGFKMMIQDRADIGLDEVAGTAFRMMVGGSRTPGLAQVFTTFNTQVPQLRVEVDRV